MHVRALNLPSIIYIIRTVNGKVRISVIIVPLVISVRTRVKIIPIFLSRKEDTAHIRKVFKLQDLTNMKQLKK